MKQLKLGVKMNKMSKYHLFQCRSVQPIRVAKGKSYWRYYNPEMLNPQEWNLRQILDSEIVIELDRPKKDTRDVWEFRKQVSLPATHLIGINLCKAGIKFEVWDHFGLSPHIHIRNLPIAHLKKDQLRLFKKLFMQKYVPKEFLEYVDYSLCGISLVRLEFAPCWKRKYGIKRMLTKA